MADALRSIVYASSATMPTDAASVEALLVEARNYNLETATTGVLLLCDGSFMQCIEGRGAGFEQTWDRIRRSRRHTHVTTMVDETIEERAFGDWQMGFFGPSESKLVAASSLQWKLDSLTRLGLRSAGLQLLQQFWRNAR